MNDENPTTINAISLNTLAKHGLRRVAAAVGVFDGVHVGHRKLLDRLRRMAASLNASPVVLTFYPHPRLVLSPREPLKLITSREKKFELLAETGIDAVVTLPFTADFARKRAGEFLDECLNSPGIEILGICVGANWRFGANGRGNAETLRSYSKRHGFKFDPVEELRIDGMTVSSTAVRRAVSGGSLDDAAKMLARRHSARGVVSRGANIASSDLKCPTANISAPDIVLPPDGVYAAFATLEDGSRHAAAVSIGVSPSFVEKHRDASLLETHILDFNGDLYGTTIEVEFLRYIREERCYPSPEALAKQIREDLAKIAKITRAEK